MKAIQNSTLCKTLFVALIAASGFLGLSGCDEKAEQTLPGRKYELTWSDEFAADSGTLPDAAKWAFDVGTGQNGWGNAELQIYTNRPSNVMHDGKGNLLITARRESFGGAGFTSARIKTQGLFEQKYGRFEARLKTPTGPGMWPAFWMLGSNINEVSWPQCGEIDIMEQKGNEPNITHGSLHGPGYSGGNSISKSFALMDGRFDDKFHVYAVEWGEDFIDFYLDNFLYKRVTPTDVKGQWVYNTPFFIILNIAVGGNFVGFPTTGTPFPQSMTVDYVRVYKQK